MTKNTISIIKNCWNFIYYAKKSMSLHSYLVGIFSYTQSISHDIQIKLLPIKTLNETRNLVKNL